MKDDNKSSEDERTHIIDRVENQFIKDLIYNEQLSTRHFIGATFVLLGVFAANLGNLLRIKNGSILKTDG